MTQLASDKTSNSGMKDCTWQARDIPYLGNSASDAKAAHAWVNVNASQGLLAHLSSVRLVSVDSFILQLCPPSRHTALAVVTDAQAAETSQRSHALQVGSFRFPWSSCIVSLCTG